LDIVIFGGGPAQEDVDEISIYIPHSNWRMTRDGTCNDN
jgi:hypothetical protein